MGTERKLGVQIDEVYIVALVKGRRMGEWNPEEGKASGPKYQNSPLVYGWYRPANPPLVEESWARSSSSFMDSKSAAETVAMAARAKNFILIY